MYSRYAIYYTPAPNSPLAEFGARWLGWDSAAGAGVAHPDCGALDVAHITATPRKYGFHATIKPPMRLRMDSDPSGLESALAKFSGRTAPVRLEGLELRSIGRFLALVPVGETAALGRFAASVVMAFDDFRAPPTDAELQKRRKSRLSPAQEENLTRWGYPYVLEEFRFHMTLSGPLEAEPREAASEVLQDLLSELALAPVTIDALTLLGEAEDGVFHQIRRFPLGG